MSLSSRSPSSTTLLEWQTRVVILNSIGVSNSSLISMAILTMSLASCELEGSIMPILAARA